MFTYCENNPVIGFDPFGHFDLGGFLAGVAIVAVGVGLLALTVATAGAASPLLAAGIAAVGTAVSVAVIETGCAITAAAATDSTAVIDVSLSHGPTRHKTGVSTVLDFNNDTAEIYTHDGVTTSSDYSCTYGAGLVFNYKSPGDYGGDFVDVSTSTKRKGVDYGIDACYSPGILRGQGGTAAIMGTVGLSIPSAIGNVDIAVGYDIYTPYYIISW